MASINGTRYSDTLTGTTGNDTLTIDQKISCYKEIAKYTLPQHKSQNIRVEQPDMPNKIVVIFVKPK